MGVARASQKRNGNVAVPASRCDGRSLPSTRGGRSTTDYSNPANQPIRILAQGRDPSATIDSGLLGTTGFQNDGDNEILGFHVSDGDPTPRGILGAKIPRPFDGTWRVFYTQQHGDNVTFEIIPNPYVAEAVGDYDGGRGHDGHRD